jgi:hypothetical protein
VERPDDAHGASLSSSVDIEATVVVENGLVLGEF